MEEESLKKRTTYGLFWGGINNVTQQGLGLLFGIILGRLLTPHDYGMIPMILVFQLIATALQESGFKSALCNLKEPTHHDYNSVFWFNILVGTLCYIFLFFVAPFIAAYYHTPELILLCRVSFLSIIFSSLGIAQSAFLFKNLKVKEQTKCNITATIISNLVGVSLALLNCGYWALAIQSMTYIGINSLLLWHFSTWRPSWQIDFQPVKRLFRFSSKLLATRILEIINSNVMNILLGRYFSTTEVGNYNQAYQWNSKVSYLLQGTLAQVVQPVFSQIADEPERNLRALRKLIRFTAFLSFPLLFGFSLVAEEFIVLAIGEKWLISSHLLQLLCISGAFVPICTVLTNLLISKGKSNIYFWCSLAQCLLLITTMLILYPYGIHRMVIVYVIIYITWTFVWHSFVWKLTGYNLGAFLFDTLPFALITLAVMVATWLITSTINSLLLLLLARIAVAVSFYFIVMKFLHVKIFQECLDFIKNQAFKKQ
ncbi:MAG: lipopolysaccharide biosynthesis protein [Bacteroidaceae bacterium]|nr:lipopolysaccharide biosynthesis protein [Bacteroidaceae bacterium]